MTERSADILARFAAAGATPVDAAVLQPADTLLDLYGEDIRARAYTTLDPIRGEMMLRPDFTVPVVQWHMENGAEPARYTYAGPVFRRQEDDPDRPTEYVQVGIEIFDRQDPAGADAEVFALVADVLRDEPVRPQTGDIGLLTAGVEALETTPARKAALLRHIWRPARFRALLNRFSQPSRPAVAKPSDAPLIGLRTKAEIEARQAALATEAETPPLHPRDVALIDAILTLEGAARTAADTIATLSRDHDALAPASDRLTQRLDALDARGIDTAVLPFQTTFGRTLLEYYDGFVFGFLNGPGTLVATGGRYDALTRMLGQGREIPAVGGVIRPDLLTEGAQ